MTMITPSLGLASYSCPHCGALAHQFWNRVFTKSFDREEQPSVWDPARINWRDKKTSDPDERSRIKKFAERLSRNVLTYCVNNNSSYLNLEMVNMAMAECHSCAGFSIWVDGQLKYPESDFAFIPHVDMPAEVKADFEEASSIFQSLPRGAAALLRLCIQKLMPHLDEKGKDINEDIASLVGKGLDPVIKQALDVVRVIGNNAVHPGKDKIKSTTRRSHRSYLASSTSSLLR